MKGKGSVFYILIPIFIVIVAFIYDNVLIVVNNKSYRSVSESIIKESLTYSYKDINSLVKDGYEKKKLETDQLYVSYDEGVLYVYNSHNYPSFFGRVFGMNSYRVEVNLKAYKNGEDIIIEDYKGEI